MTRRNICPICGNENPEGAQFCEVCQANLQTLPNEMFPEDTTPIEEIKAPAPEPVQNETAEQSHDPSMPIWLKERLKSNENKQPMDFDAFTDALFGISSNASSSGRGAAGSSRPARQPRAKKTEPVYQPPLDNLIDPPLIEPDDITKSFPEDIPGITDFRFQRPARKWEDQKPKAAEKRSSSVSLLTDFSSNRPAKKWDDSAPSEGAKAQQLPLWWQQDPPLVEIDEAEETAKTTDNDDPELDNSVSPTKVIDAGQIFGSDNSESVDLPEEGAPAQDADIFQPESGSLLSDLMDEMNSSSTPLTPAEQRENQNGTVFFSGNHPAEEGAAEPEDDLLEISVTEDNTGADAEMLDRILRNIGYEVAGEAQPVPVEDHEDSKNDVKPEETVTEPEADNVSDITDNTENDEKEEKSENFSGKVSNILKPLHGIFTPREIDNPLIPDDESDTLSEKDADPYGLLDEKMPEKEDAPDDQDIPWDLFGSADMTLPQSPEDPAYRTFSRSSVPQDPGSTSYQQRMISSVLGKIIQAENFVQPEKEKNNREIGFPARLFLAVLAIVGVIVILTTGLTDRIQAPEFPASREAAAFYEAAETASGNALVVIDYTPAYASLMDTPAEVLLNTLETHAEKVYVSTLNPAAMPIVREVLNKHAEKLEFSGWWPAGVLSVRTRLSFRNIPEQVWLLTAESASVRSWAEQLAVSDEEYQLHVMAPGQLRPLLQSYQDAGMIQTLLSYESDLLDYGSETHTANRTQMAVWYLAALIPLAWLFGIIGKTMKTEPNYGRKSTVRADEAELNEEKESEDD